MYFTDAYRLKHHSFVHNTEVEIKLTIKVLKNIQDLSINAWEKNYPVGIGRKCLTSYKVENKIIYNIVFKHPVALL
jgi:hypothetical protein